MLAQSWELTTAETVLLREVGVATMARQAISGDEPPSRHPAIAEALPTSTMEQNRQCVPLAAVLWI
jgi:hypothetical protein